MEAPPCGCDGVVECAKLIRTFCLRNAVGPACLNTPRRVRESQRGHRAVGGQTTAETTVAGGATDSESGPWGIGCDSLYGSITSLCHTAISERLQCVR